MWITTHANGRRRKGYGSILKDKSSRNEPRNAYRTAIAANVGLSRRRRIAELKMAASAVLDERWSYVPYPSLLLQQGESPVYVKEQMGHSSISVTVDLYGHLIPGGNRQAADRLDDR